MSSDNAVPKIALLALGFCELDDAYGELASQNSVPSLQRIVASILNGMCLVGHYGSMSAAAVKCMLQHDVMFGSVFVRRGLRVQRCADRWKTREQDCDNTGYENAVEGTGSAD